MVELSRIDGACALDLVRTHAPAEHRGVSREELAEIIDGSAFPARRKIDPARVLRILANRNTILLTLSYMIMNYVFFLLSNWSFLYLLQERHFSLLKSGWLAAGPPLAAAAGAAGGGALAAWLCKRFGVVWGFRIVPLAGLLAAALLLLMTTRLANPYAAVVTLTLCFGFVELTEGSFWGAAETVGRSDTMILSGIVNTGGCLGGIIRHSDRCASLGTSFLGCSVRNRERECRRQRRHLARYRCASVDRPHRPMRGDHGPSHLNGAVSLNSQSRNAMIFARFAMESL